MDSEINVEINAETEIPQTIKYGELVWVRNQTVESTQYSAICPGVGDFLISRYEHGFNKGRWFWGADFNQITSQVYKPSVLNMRGSGVVDEIDEAMLACLDARGAFIEDMRQLLSLLCPGDDYAKGRRAGQEEVKQRLINFLQ